MVSFNDIVASLVFLGIDTRFNQNNSACPKLNDKVPVTSLSFFVSRYTSTFNIHNPSVSVDYKNTEIIPFFFLDPL